VVDEDPAHDPRGHSEKVSPIPPIDVALVNESQKHLVHQGGGLERVAGSLASKLTCRNPTQLGVHERQQLIERALVAAAPVSEERSDIAGRGHNSMLSGVAAHRIWRPEFNRKNSKGLTHLSPDFRDLD
jgi:hypothetical protein